MIVGAIWSNDYQWLQVRPIVSWGEWFTIPEIMLETKENLGWNLGLGISMTYVCIYIIIYIILLQLFSITFYFWCYDYLLMCTYHIDMYIYIYVNVYACVYVYPKVPKSIFLIVFALKSISRCFLIVFRIHGDSRSKTLHIHWNIFSLVLPSRSLVQPWLQPPRHVAKRPQERTISNVRTRIWGTSDLRQVTSSLGASLPTACTSSRLAPTSTRIVNHTHSMLRRQVKIYLGLSFAHCNAHRPLLLGWALAIIPWEWCSRHKP